jgi:hypothetical protein
MSKIGWKAIGGTIVIILGVLAWIGLLLSLIYSVCTYCPGASSGLCTFL